MSRWCALGVYLLSALIAFSSDAAAQVATWNGGGATENWSDGANWSTATMPMSGTAIFDGTSVKNCTMDDAASGIIINVQAGYTGTLTQTVALSPASYSQADGTFNGSAQNITISGAFSLSGGSFSSTTAAFSA
ncbi:MAG: hypothetical protein HYY16_01600, partial [Planctomycetes bacterium]|nr:hypothetical protein [Planctomycetota bacterium]